jgi:radical SAM family uncharacterized protein/radical SAM-linked protein
MSEAKERAVGVPVGRQEEMESLLAQVEKPGRYIGGEWNEIRKDPSRVAVKVGLVFPDVYEIGMSYLGQKILYAELNRLPEVAAERIFAPWPDMEAELRRRRLPLFSLENKIPLPGFDILGFSLLYELNDSNILTILDLGRVPWRASERSRLDPLVIAGGPAAFNPEPLADFFDMFVLGDGEEAFLEVVDLVGRQKTSAASRTERLADFAALPGVYVPSLYRAERAERSPLLIPRPILGAPAKIKKRLLRTFGRSAFPEKIIVPDVQSVFDRVAVEASRGCPQRCRFCQAASVYFPYRVKNPRRLAETVLNSVRQTGYQDASLSALSISDYPYLEDIIGQLMEELRAEEVSLSLPSLRPKGLTSSVAANIIKVRKTGFTLVPEAGTERLRRVINKDLSDEEIGQAAQVAFSRGWRLLKLYFMLGLPTEKQEDLEGIIHIVQDILSLGARALGQPPLINVSLSSFIPKPHTPFQWMAMEGDNVLEEKQRFIRMSLRKHNSVKIKVHRVAQSVLEGVFSRGDRKLGRVLLAAWRAGARFDGWKDRWNFDIWDKAFIETGVDRGEYLAGLDLDAELPWDFIETGVKKEFLKEEFRRALRQEPTASCLGTDCGQCGGCEPGFRVDKDYREQVEVKPSQAGLLGSAAGEEVRYRATYEKIGRARFLGHNDLINTIRRGFRRAGVAVLYSTGFHPKMRMSFLPALPLGMEGLAEALEFKSDRLIEESVFLAHINKSLPEGVHFLSLQRLTPAARALSEDAVGFVYSLDLNRREVKDALEALAKRHTSPASGSSRREHVLVSALGDAPPEANVKVSLDEDGNQIFLRVGVSASKCPRPQETIKRILGLENPVFYMSRRAIQYRSTR